MPQPRRAGPVWAWALALLVLIILIVVLFTRRERVAPADPPAAPATETAATAGAWDAEPRAAELAELESLASPVPLASLLPLRPAHTGVLVSFDGVVESEVRGLGHWVRAAEGGAVFVRLLEPRFDAGVVGEAISGRGAIRFDSDGRLAARLARSGAEPPPHDADFGEYYIETTSSRLRVP